MVVERRGVYWLQGRDGSDVRPRWGVEVERRRRGSGSDEGIRTAERV